MAAFVAHRKNRRDRQRAAVIAALNTAVRVVSVNADVSDGSVVITFNQAIQNLPTWTAGMMTFDNGGVARADSAWVLTSPTVVTVTVAALAAGRILVTFGADASAIAFFGVGTVVGQTAGGGCIA
jgi:hypothetical protein